MSEKQLLIYFLSQFDLAPNKVEEILNGLNGNFTFSALSKLKLDKIVSAVMAEKILERAEERYAKIYLENLEAIQIKLICKYDEDFPKKLLAIDDGPFFLFYKGDISLANLKSVAIVGTRLPSNYGRMITEKFAKTLANAGLVIISGLAYGIDSIAHRQALNQNGKTIAVLGSGLNNIYPADHSDLAREIAEKGLLISEYCPSAKATRYSFPTRNRIIAGLCDGVLITEAGIKSGTLYTRDYALDYGKEMFAVPGNIDSDKSALPNEIICSGQGMGVRSAEDILKVLHVENVAKKEKKKVQSLTIDEQAIYSQLADGAKSLEELEKNCNMSMSDLNSCLTMLELRGIISRMPGGVFCLC